MSFRTGKKRVLSYASVSIAVIGLWILLGIDLLMDKLDEAESR